MIVDKVSNAKQYAGLHPGIDQVLKLAQAYTPENYPGGRVVVDGEKVFMNLAGYETHPVGEACMEAHRQYIDVMYMVEGSETIYVTPVDELKEITQEYDPEHDVLLAKFPSAATAVRVEAGTFVVLFPQDAHAPGCYGDGPCTVKKIIGKVQING